LATFYDRDKHVELCTVNINKLSVGTLLEAYIHNAVFENHELPKHNLLNSQILLGAFGYRFSH